MTKITSKTLAKKIVAANEGKTRKEVICLIMQELNMTDAGASTYYYNAQKEIKTERALAQIAAEDAGIADQINDAKTTTIEDTSAPVVAETAKEKKLVAARKATTKSATPDYSIDGSDEATKEIDAIVDSINVDEVPAFLKK